MSDQMFVDESVFQGVKEFNTPDGMVRFEQRPGDFGCAVWTLTADNFWRYQGRISPQLSNSCQRLYNYAKELDFI